MKKVSLTLLVVLYCSAGIYHFINPNFYEAILPAYLGYHKLLIYSSGVCEFLLGLLLVFQKTRKTAAILIIIMLTIFLWLHIQMLVDYWKNGNKLLWLAILRIPLQFVLIGWAYSFTRKNKTQ